MTLEGKTLFISGGSRGIGLAIAIRAARDGANVAPGPIALRASPGLLRYRPRPSAPPGRTSHACALNAKPSHERA